MKLRQLIDEMQAEIVNGQIPSNKIFNDNGNIIVLKDGDEWRKILGEILVAIKKAGLETEFTRDLDPVDIHGSKSTGIIYLQSDTGKKYTYNINNKKLIPA